MKIPQACQEGPWFRGKVKHFERMGYGLTLDEIIAMHNNAA